MQLTLIQKLRLIESHHWIGLGYEFLEKTAKEAADFIARQEAIDRAHQDAFDTEQRNL